MTAGLVAQVTQFISASSTQNQAAAGIGLRHAF
jgi:hypothetical protein